MSLNPFFIFPVEKIILPVRHFNRNSNSITILFQDVKKIEKNKQFITKFVSNSGGRVLSMRKTHLLPEKNHITARTWLKNWFVGHTANYKKRKKRKGHIYVLELDVRYLINSLFVFYLDVILLTVCYGLGVGNYCFISWQKQNTLINLHRRVFSGWHDGWNARNKMNCLSRQ